MTSPTSLLKGTTKGPWQVFKHKGSLTFDVERKNYPRWMIARVLSGPKEGREELENEANARLIAAAPELARRLEEAEELIEWVMENVLSIHLSERWQERAEALLKEGK